MFDETKREIHQAVRRLRENAFGPVIFDEVCKSTGKDEAMGKIFMCLDQMVSGGYLHREKRMRNGKESNWFRVTGKLLPVKGASASDRLPDGLKPATRDIAAI